MTISVSGHLSKMQGQLAEQVNYTLPVDDHRVPISDLLDKPISIEYLGDIHCIHCGRRSKKALVRVTVTPVLLSYLNATPAL